MSLTVSLITQAASYSTVNAINGSGMWFQAQSTNYSLSNFKYVFDLYEKDITTGAVIQSLGQYPEPPRPYNPISNLTGTGLFNPYKALRSVINNQPDFPINVYGIQPVTASYVRYGVDYGFSYNPGFTFSTSKITVFTTNFLAIDYSSGTDIKTGDFVTLNMSNNLYNPQYNTTGLVASAGATQALTNILYGVTPSTPETGVITNLQRVSGTAGDYYGWNGTRQYTEGGLNYADFNQQFVLVNAATSSFLTDYKSTNLNNGLNGKPTVLGQYETIGFLSDPQFPVEGFELIRYDSNGSVVGVSRHTLTASYPSRKYEFGVGTQNLIDAYGVNFTGCDYYTCIFYIITGFMPVTYFNIGLVNRYINRDCNYCWYNGLQNFNGNATQSQPVQLTFLNRRGSYEYYTFNKDSQRTIQVQKKEWMNNMSWNYEQGQRINSVLSQDVEIDYVVNSDWVSQYDQNWLEEILTSPEVYYIDGINRIPIYITDTSWVSKTNVRDNIFMVTIGFKLAYPLNTVDQ